MGRICLIFIGLTVITHTLSAQYLEFVENKGQWDSTVKFEALLTTGAVILQKNGFAILQQDTNDLRRIHRVMHGEDVIDNGVVSKAAVKTSAAVGGHGNPGDGGGAGGGSGASGGRGAPGSGNPGDPYLLHSHIYRVSFENANPNVEIVPEKAMSGVNNYITGNKKNSATNCKVYQGVVYKNLYPGIDMHYYTEQGFVKYDLIVHPGADPNSIVLRYDGQNKLSLRKNQIMVQTSVGTVKELEPRSYQLTAGGRADVKCNYTMPDANHVRFKVESYSADATLVIDPTEIFCSFTGSVSDNWGYTATYDKDGDFFLGGIVLQYPGRGGSGSSFGATAGAFQSTFQGGDGTEGSAINDQGTVIFTYDYDIGLMKFNPDGRTRLWATYLGGKGDEQPHSLICDPQGNLIITGRTSSADFPPVSPLSTFGPCKGLDLFVAKLSANGSTLMGSKKIGGSGDDGVNNSPKYLNAFGKGTQELRLNYGDDGRSEVILDAAGNIYVAACTRPGSNGADFPVTAGAFQPAFGGGTQDGVVLKLSPDVNTVLFSSYIGGSGVDAAFVLALDPLNNNIYVAGGTTSQNLNGTANGTVVRPASRGDIDGFVSIINNTGSALIKSTYFGTDGATDMIYGVAFDKKGFPYIMGTTYSVIPVVNSPFNQTSPGSAQASGKQFITKLQPDLSAIVYSANFGPAGVQYPNISPTAFLVDRCENVYVSGWGGGIDPGDRYNNSGTNGLTTTADAIKKATDNADFYFFVLQKNASAQLYGSFFGQTEAQNGQESSLGDHVDGGTSRFDEQGVIYQAICANCGGVASFPTSTNAAFTRNGALGIGGCNEAAVKIAFQFAGVAAGLKAVTHGRGDSVGCVPLTVSFRDTILNAKSYVWNFGDGTIVKTTDPAPDHMYTAVGNYRVMLVAIDSNSCNVADTVYHTIEVRDNPAFLDFRYDKDGPCEQFNYIFTNLSTHAPGAPDFTDTSFTWNFGDGPTLVRGGVIDRPIHSYSSPGPYNVTLTLVDTNYCNYPLDTVKLLYVVQNVKAQFTTPAFGCVPYTAVFSNTSVAGQKFYWNFGDGSPIDSVDLSPSHLYANVGQYTVTLKAVDSATCNITDTYTLTLNVQGKPVAGFTFSPLPPQPPNTPTIFTDASTPAVKYQWSFGDGSSETKTTPDTVIHQYIKTDTFQVCLVVTNESGCTDTACHAVPAVIDPLLDVPNAFTPGRFGQNGIVKVVGFGIQHMVWRIYNRWGQKVFESNDPYIGWDGTYRGQLQPMDVYGYTLEVEFSDGTHTSKKGDITLIR